MTETTTSNFLIDVIADVPDGEIRRTVDIYNVNGTIYGGQTFANRGGSAWLSKQGTWPGNSSDFGRAQIQEQALHLSLGKLLRSKAKKASMSNSTDPKRTVRPTSIHPSAPRQKLRSRRDSSAAPKYAPRRTQAERSETTRKQLLSAAAKLIRQKGFAGLRTIEVAKAAGVSRGALLHHFPSKHDLVLAVLTYVNEFTFAQSKYRAELARTSGDPIEEIIKDAQEFFLGDYFFIELAIAMSDEGTRRLKREMHELTRQSRFSVEAAWLETLISSGIPKELARDVLALTLSAVRGFSVRMLIENDREQFTRLMNVWRDIIHRHLAASIPTMPRRLDRKS